VTVRRPSGGPDVLGDLGPTPPPQDLPAVASFREATSWLDEQALTPFIEVRTERLAEIDRVAEHVELSLTASESTNRLRDPPRQ